MYRVHMLMIPELLCTSVQSTMCLRSYIYLDLVNWQVSLILFLVIFIAYKRKKQYGEDYRNSNYFKHEASALKMSFK